jgi:hypothetical protein
MKIQKKNYKTLEINIFKLIILYLAKKFNQFYFSKKGYLLKFN